MRDRKEIEAEIDRAQVHLSENLAELKGLLADKVDVKARVQRRVDATKTRAIDAASRGFERVDDGYARARRFVHDRPVIAVLLATGVTLAVIGAFTVRRWFTGHERRALPAGRG